MGRDDLVPPALCVGGIAFFGEAKRLTDIQYKGSVEEWQAMEKGGYWDFSYAGDYTVTCTDGTVDKQGNVTYFES